MTNIVIRCEKLSKRYRIRHQHERQRYVAMRDVVADKLLLPWQWLKRRSTNGNGDSPLVPGAVPKIEEFWALKDISFEIKQGEVVGIIGHNGAGKSTLLKVLSRITEPTEGYVQIRGRVASLLEVGTGFHPELTGRENIFLNGAVLGMTKSEIKRKFNEIVAFAEVEQFLDTPVKRYSSGMYVRLAFAVAAHLEPEILLVDEVLAVGDAAFQKKCLGKMSDVAREGRTVLFVSHNMTAILSLCEKGFLLNNGYAMAEGACKEVIEVYLQSINKVTVQPLAQRLDRHGDQRLRFLGFEIRDSDGSPLSCACTGQDMLILLRYQCLADSHLRNVHVALGIHGKFDENLFHLSTSVSGFDFEYLPAAGEIFCRIPRIPLQPGRYSFNLFCTVGGEVADWVQNAGTFDVEAGDFFGSGKLPPQTQGPFIVEHSWGFSAAKLFV